MCGIFGIVWRNSDRVPSELSLEKTAELISHRGPNGHGVYANKGIGLVHTRLSLVDLSSHANQPFWDRKQRYCLVFNGEIYNFKELKTELEREIQFRTTSDTEVLLESLLKYGFEATLPKLEGMFAFALYDTVEQTVVLARDRFGIKPLFIYDDRDTFMFASEVRAMRPWLDLKPDPMTVSSYLQGFDESTRGFSFYENIKVLTPGGTIKLSLSKGTTSYGEFFRLSNLWNRDEANKLRQLKPRQVIDLVEEQLLDSVNLQMFADAQVGALCSGGVDSSLILAMAAVRHQNLAIFHANVVGPHSEYQAAVQLAKHLKLDLKTVEVSDRDFIDLFPLAIEHYGHPFLRNPHSIPFLKVSQLVRNSGVKAVLSGEGSDECYLGYSWLAPNITQWRRTPLKSLQKQLQKLNSATTPFPNYWQTSYLNQPTLAQELHNRFGIALEAASLREHFEQLQASGENIDKKSTLFSLDMLNHNLRALLHRNDSMGMSAAIESRFPFLDSRVVKTAVNLPYNYKIRFSLEASDRSHLLFQDKWVLRQVADRYLPLDLSRRPKKPFTVNVFDKFQIAPAFFNNSFISDLFKLSSQETEYLIDRSDRAFKLRLLHLNVWGDVCIRKLPKQSVVEQMHEQIAIS